MDTRQGTPILFCLGVNVGQLGARTIHISPEGDRKPSFACIRRCQKLGLILLRRLTLDLRAREPNTEWCWDTFRATTWCTLLLASFFWLSNVSATTPCAPLSPPSCNLELGHETSLQFWLPPKSTLPLRVMMMMGLIHPSKPPGM